LVSATGVFCFEQDLTKESGRLIVDNCQHLKKLTLEDSLEIDDVIRMIKKLGKQLTTLVLNADSLTDAGYLYLNNCAR
jgi:hypothetical protein